jgi:hypothetical protein
MKQKKKNRHLAALKAWRTRRKMARKGEVKLSVNMSELVSGKMPYGKPPCKKTKCKKGKHTFKYDAKVRHLAALKAWETRRETIDVFKGV